MTTPPEGIDADGIDAGGTDAEDGTGPGPRLDPGGGGPAGRLVVRVRVPSADAELVADRLFGLGASAVSHEDRNGGEMDLVADLATDAPLEGIGHPVTVVAAESTWADGWREHARVWTAGRFRVRPPWLPAPADPTGTLRSDLVELVVDPGPAFGSGSHPSTRLCLELLADVVGVDDVVADVGCGSGILSVAAARVGCARVEAIDVDPAAVERTTAVAVANGVADRIEVRRATATDLTGRFDVVLANLLIPIIEDSGPALAAAVAPGGALVLAGLLAGHRKRAVDAVAPLRVETDRTDGDWIALVLRRV